MSTFSGAAGGRYCCGWLARVEAATSARARAQAELDRRAAAWRKVIAGAMRAQGVSRQAIAAAAGVTIGRA